MDKKNNKKIVKVSKCPKCNSFLSYDLFEPTCIMCGWVDCSVEKAKGNKNITPIINLNKLNKTG